MRLGRRRSKIGLALEPGVLRPTDSLSAAITIGERIDRVGDARVQLGYVNTYSYRWAGRPDIVLRIPSWAPRSSQSIVRWVVRVRVDARGAPTSRSRRPAPCSPRRPPSRRRSFAFERLMGDSSDLVVVTERPSIRAGEPLRGTVTLTAKSELPEADLAVFLQRERASHPLARTPGNGTT